MSKHTDPPERLRTDRQAIFDVLTKDPLFVLEISGLAGVSEKDVYQHLANLLRSKGKYIGVEPAKCRECGFVFVKRYKLTKPGRCPKCRARRILAARFYLK